MGPVTEIRIQNKPQLTDMDMSMTWLRPSARAPPLLLLLQAFLASAAAAFIIFTSEHAARRVRLPDSSPFGILPTYKEINATE